MKKTYGLFAIVSLLMLFMSVGCAPSTFIKGRPGGWKTIELNENLVGNYASAWQKTVDTVARDYDIELLDKDSGYLRTAWMYGISGGIYHRYRGRLTIKYPEITNPGKVEVKTDAQWLSEQTYGIWQRGWDSSFDRDVFTALSGRLGRTVSPD
jgi:hypothetical protein